MTQEQGARKEPDSLGKPVVALAFASIALVFSTMIIGVYFGSLERGIACREWPLCPNGLFNPPEDGYFVEYLHRLVAAVAAAFVYATAAVVAARTKVRKARIGAGIAALVISVQIVLGILVVFTSLEPLVVASHTSAAVTAFAFTLLTFLWIGIWRASR